VNEARRGLCSLAVMATHREYLDEPVELPKRHATWFRWLMVGFALLLLVAVGYNFFRIASVPMPRLDVPGAETPPERAVPATAPPRPAAPER